MTLFLQITVPTNYCSNYQVKTSKDILDKKNIKKQLGSRRFCSTCAGWTAVL